MTELSLYTGFAGDRTTIHVDWFDHNNCRQLTDVEINIQEQDKPRTLEIRINGAMVALIPAKS